MRLPLSKRVRLHATIAPVAARLASCSRTVASGTLTVADKGIANTQITKALPAP